MKLVIYLTTVLVLAAGPLWAWGPITHLEYAGHALTQLALFLPVVKKLIGRHREHFLYGVVAADITLGKNLRGYLYNCHNWDVAFNLFDQNSTSDTRQAFMLGYMGHLAADTVAHNFFVPYKMVRSWNKRLLNHAYWEVRFDQSVPEKYWNQLGHFLSADFDDDDELLEGHLKRTFFSFRTNKKIFNGLLRVQQLKRYQEITRQHHLGSTLQIDEADIKDYKNMAISAMVDFLKDPHNSFVLKADPTGKDKIRQCRDLIGDIRKASAVKPLAPKQAQAVLDDTKNALKYTIYNGEPLPDIQQYF